MPYRAAIFDLDGTLLDTLQDIADAANQALADFGLPTYTTDEYRHLVGEGVAMLFTKAIPDSSQRPELVRECVERFRETYHLQWDAHTKAYPGVMAALERLRSLGIPLAVLSNKPDEFTKLCVQRYFPADMFQLVWGHRPGWPTKPDPASARELARLLGVAPQAIAYVGDTNVDMQTAVAAGMFPVGVLWGFRDAAELREQGAAVLLERPEQWLPLFATDGE